MAKKRQAPLLKKMLAKGRPPLAPKPQAVLSKKATQKLIRSHHGLNKKLAKAEARGDKEEVDKLNKQINDSGGLSSYQLASIQGQSSERGGDSSVVLVEWLKDIKVVTASSEHKLRMLEVGALSTDNACFKSGLFDIERIDLNSQAPGIKKQDFMERPVPQFEKDQFDIISLSLVLNFVPTEEGRGAMLKRTCQFLDQRAPRTMPKGIQDNFPALFLVLPAPSVVNSRYFNDERLTLMMASLGYVMLRREQKRKLVYYLWLLRDKPSPDEQHFRKEIIKSGGNRNNFCITMKP
ncbi:25S rRNA (adenine2142-N1)-methyltransferase [Saxophila tyrrhenica]|uniref:25S rRNA adenine-N(1) methyltransferase n=1 Tax=Saxophila tyrrhenica TaxID=1690608 RepID=A0AAV9P0L6_9PEZI|nr:25S rRNA (adenine2142-N1)-methyltransferase [Saxophila tyrrhenica]